MQSYVSHHIDDGTDSGHPDVPTFDSKHLTFSDAPFLWVSFDDGNSIRLFVPASRGGAEFLRQLAVVAHDAAREIDRAL
jgi:hypothetical protein